MGNGALRETIAWSGKIELSIRGIGWTPPGIEGIDYNQDIVIKCTRPRVKASTANIIIIPATRRGDAGYEPTASAVVNGRTIATTISLIGNTATLPIIAGASTYRVQYYPEITARAQLEAQDTDMENSHGWSFTAREI